MKITGVRIGWFSFLLMMVAFHLQADEFGTIVHVTGAASVKSRLEVDWRVAVSGERLYYGDIISTGGDASILILNPDGSLFSTTEVREIIYNPFNQPSPDSGRDVLATYFDRLENSAKPRVRGGVANQQEWIRLLRQERFTSADLEMSFAMINDYSRRGMRNRVNAILLKLSEAFPENPGFFQLVRQAQSGLQPQIKWEVTQVLNGSVFPVASGQRLMEGDHLQIQYLKNEESYYYLFVTTQPRTGGIRTRLITPTSVNAIKRVNGNHYFESQREAKERFLLKLTSEDWMSTNMVGMEHFWGWSCDGPLISEEAVRAAVDRLERYVDLNRVLSDHEVERVAPPLCRSAFSLSVEYVPKQPVALSH